MLRYFELVRYQVYANLKAEAARGGLGILWWIIDPVLYMCAFYVVFQFVLHRGGDDFIPFLITGLTVWKWFASSVMQGSLSINAAGRIMSQVHVPKFTFLIVSVFTGTVKFLVVLLVLMAFLTHLGFSASLAWLSLPLLVVTQLVFILFVSGMFAVALPFFIDIKIIIENALILGLFVSGTFYDIQAATGKTKFFLSLNPMANLIVEYRSVLMRGEWPDFIYLGNLFSLSLVGLSVVFIITRKLDRIYPKIIS
jgi:lipopolysaccharide transport system permease protein